MKEQNKIIKSQTEKRKKRKYYRKCGNCKERHEQSAMIRTDQSDNGWLCAECYEELNPCIDNEW